MRGRRLLRLEQQRGRSKEAWRDRVLRDKGCNQVGDWTARQPFDYHDRNAPRLEFVGVAPFRRAAVAHLTGQVPAGCRTQGHYLPHNRLGAGSCSAGHGRLGCWSSYPRDLAVLAGITRQDAQVRGAARYPARY